MTISSCYNILCELHTIDWHFNDWSKLLQLGLVQGACGLVVTLYHIVLIVILPRLSLDQTRERRAGALV